MKNLKIYEPDGLNQLYKNISMEDVEEYFLSIKWNFLLKFVKIQCSAVIWIATMSEISKHDSR